MTQILLIEDNELNRDMLARRLERAGYHVICASTGMRGIEMAHELQPDLILMDLRLPDINGWEAARRIKRDLVTSRTPLLALTAHAMEGDRERAIEAGYDDYETKPVDMSRLLVKITHLLERGPTLPPAQGGETLPLA